MEIVTNLVARLRPAATSCASIVSRYRHPFLVAATLLFVSGLVWSVFSLHLQFDELQLLPALLLLFVLGPISTCYGAVGLLLLAAVAGVRISLPTAMRVSAYGQLAEVLPVPGGAILRAGALIRAGAGTVDSSGLVVASSVLWIAMAAAATGAVILDISKSAGLAMLFGGLAVSGGVCWWFAQKSSWPIVLLTLAHRTTGLLVSAARLKCAFAILSVSLPLARCLPFALATIMGSASSFAPAGLGVSEALGAVIAGSLSVAAPSAFLALALNRLLALLAAAFVGIVSEAAQQPANEAQEQRRIA